MTRIIPRGILHSLANTNSHETTAPKLHTTPLGTRIA